MKKSILTAGALSLLVCWGCDMGPRLETRTFRLAHLRPSEAVALIDPYVYGSRDGDPGAVSVIEGAISVRETRDNLDQIERVLAEFDERRPDIRLRFQLIEADGFTDSDPRIAAVEGELRKLFQFVGYRLAGEATITTSDGTDMSQHLTAADGMFQVTGSVYRMDPTLIRLEEIVLWDDGEPRLQTTINIRPGQTIVLGSSPKRGSSATLFLTVRAEDVSAGG